MKQENRTRGKKNGEQWECPHQKEAHEIAKRVVTSHIPSHQSNPPRVHCAVSPQASETTESSSSSFFHPPADHFCFTPARHPVLPASHVTHPIFVSDTSIASSNWVEWFFQFSSTLSLYNPITSKNERAAIFYHLKLNLLLRFAFAFGL